MTKDEYNPEKNPKAIFIVQDEDGNWRAKGQRFGELIEVRDANAETVLKLLLTHDGKKA